MQGWQEVSCVKLFVKEFILYQIKNKANKDVTQIPRTFLLTPNFNISSIPPPLFPRLRFAAE